MATRLIAWAADIRSLQLFPVDVWSSWGRTLRVGPIGSLVHRLRSSLRLTVLAFWTTVSGSIARVAPGRRTRVASRGASELTLRLIIGLLLIAVLFFDIRSLRGIRSALWLTEAALWSIVAGSISRVAPGRRTSMESGATVGTRATLLKLWVSIRARARLRAC